MAARQPVEEIVRVARANVTERSSASPAVVENLRRALAEWDAFPARFFHATRGLLIFEAWNLLVIGVALVGFNYVPALAACRCTSWGIWIAAIGTVGVTGYTVFAWTRA